MGQARDRALRLYDVTAARTSANVLAAYSTSFGLGTRLLGRRAQQDIRAVYALVRLADEVVDTYRGDDAGAELDELEEQTHRALRTGYSTNLVVHAFARTARRVGITTAETVPFFASMRADLDGARARPRELRGLRLRVRRGGRADVRAGVPERVADAGRPGGRAVRAPGGRRPRARGRVPEDQLPARPGHRQRRARTARTSRTPARASSTRRAADRDPRGDRRRRRRGAVGAARAAAARPVRGRRDARALPAAARRPRAVHARRAPRAAGSAVDADQAARRRGGRASRRRGRAGDRTRRRRRRRDRRPDHRRAARPRGRERDPARAARPGRRAGGSAGAGRVPVRHRAVLVLHAGGLRARVRAARGADRGPRRPRAARPGVPRCSPRAGRAPGRRAGRRGQLEGVRRAGARRGRRDAPVRAGLDAGLPRRARLVPLHDVRPTGPAAHRRGRCDARARWSTCSPTRSRSGSSGTVEHPRAAPGARLPRGVPRQLAVPRPRSLLADEPPGPRRRRTFPARRDVHDHRGPRTPRRPRGRPDPHRRRGGVDRGRARHGRRGVARGVRLAAGEVVPADVVVSAADRHHTETELLDPRVQRPAGRGVGRPRARASRRW